jgi:muconolactone D-isomerase
MKWTAEARSSLLDVSACAAGTSRSGTALRSQPWKDGMLFHVNMDVRIPPGMAPEKIKQLGALEHERARELQLQRKWLHLWRVVGKFANVSVFDVESPAELHDILNSLPLYPFMEIELTALCRHPGAVEMTE